MPVITDISNLPAIYDAAFATAAAATMPDGITPIAWADTIQGLWPENAEVTGYPTLIVPYPDFAGFGHGGHNVGDVEQEDKVMEQFWFIHVFVVAPYERGNRLTWQTPMEALGLLQRAFRANRLLGDTCFNSKQSKPHLLEYEDKSDPQLRFFGCQLTIRAYEQILTPDS